MRRGHVGGDLDRTGGAAARVRRILRRSALGGCTDAKCTTLNGQARSADVASAALRNDAQLGWVVDVKLTPAAAARLARDTSFTVFVQNTPVTATRVGETFVLSGTPHWDQATANETLTYIKG